MRGVHGVCAGRASGRCVSAVCMRQSRTHLPPPPAPLPRRRQAAPLPRRRRQARQAPPLQPRRQAPPRQAHHSWRNANVDRRAVLAWSRGFRRCGKTTDRETDRQKNARPKPRWEDGRRRIAQQHGQKPSPLTTKNTKENSSPQCTHPSCHAALDTESAAGAAPAGAPPPPLAGTPKPTEPRSRARSSRRSLCLRSLNWYLAHPACR